MVLKLQQALESPGGPPKTQVAGPRPECLSHRCEEEPTHLVMLTPGDRASRPAAVAFSQGVRPRLAPSA